MTSKIQGLCKRLVSIYQVQWVRHLWCNVFICQGPVTAKKRACALFCCPPSGRWAPSDNVTLQRHMSPGRNYRRTIKHCYFNIKYQNIRWVSQNTTLYYGVRCQNIDMFRPFSIRPSSGLTWLTKHVCLLTTYTVIKCCVLTHPPDIILIFDIVIFPLYFTMSDLMMTL